MLIWLSLTTHYNKIRANQTLCHTKMSLENPAPEKSFGIEKLFSETLDFWCNPLCYSGEHIKGLKNLEFAQTSEAAAKVNRNMENGNGKIPQAVIFQTSLERQRKPYFRLK